MFPQGVFARQKVDLDGPFTVARRDMVLSVSGYGENVVIPVGAQLPDWRKLNLLERQVKQMFALGYLEQAKGNPFKMPPTDAQRAATASKGAQQGAAAGRR